MEKKEIRCCKVAGKLPLALLAERLKVPEAGIRRGTIIIEDDDGGKSVCLYACGCISFIGFRPEEKTAFLQELVRLSIPVDYDLASRFNEGRELDREEDESAAADVLARSVELEKMEEELSAVLDEAERFLHLLGRGLLRADLRRVSAMLSKSIGFKIRSAEGLSLLNRPREERAAYDRIAQMYELDARYAVLADKLELLDRIMGKYAEYGGRQAERRLVLFEILLLASFPLMHLIL